RLAARRVGAEMGLWTVSARAISGFNLGAPAQLAKLGRCTAPAKSAYSLDMRERYFEDFAVGQTFLAGPTAPLTAEQIKAFAGQFDPQPFHLDEEAAKRSIFKGLAASGWHTASLTMRLFVESDVQPVGGYVGMGGEQLRWPRPTRPGDTLRVEIQVTETRPSKSRPDAW